MTYLQLEAMAGRSEATMTGGGFSPTSADTIRFDEQERLDVGWQATKVSGLGMAPVSITVTPSQVGSTARFVRRLERDIDIALSLKANDRPDRGDRVNKLRDILADECILRVCQGSGGGIALPSDYSYLRVRYAGGGTYSLGGDDGAVDTDLELVITLRAHKPDWQVVGVGGGA